MITFICIISWVVMNGGHIAIDDQFVSTINLKVTAGFRTNFTDDDFNFYVTPYERINYNQLWDYTDYAFEFPNEIQIISNLVITPNQTQTVCPEHPGPDPELSDSICDPKNNTCVNGVMRPHGVQTGNCVPSDFPLRDEYGNWRYGHNCEISGMKV